MPETAAQPDTATDAIAAKVHRLLVDVLGIEADKVVAGASLEDDLGADSLDFIELLMTAEDEFDLEIRDDAAERCKTVGDVVDLVRAMKAG